MIEWREVMMTGTRYRVGGKGIMSNFDVCANYGAGICEKKGNTPRPCGKCEQFKY